MGVGGRLISRAYGHDVSMTAQLFPPATVSEQLANTGFTMIARMTREAGPLNCARRCASLTAQVRIR